MAAWMEYLRRLHPADRRVMLADLRLFLAAHRRRADMETTMTHQPKGA